MSETDKTLESSTEALEKAEHKLQMEADLRIDAAHDERLSTETQPETVKPKTDPAVQ